MAAKKHKKRPHRPAADPNRQIGRETPAGGRDRSGKRMKPAARALLLGDLVFLAVVSLLDGGRDGQGVLSPTVSGLCTILGAILLLAALWLQFGGGRGGGQGPRL